MGRLLVFRTGRRVEMDNTSALLTAIMNSVVQTLTLNGVDVRDRPLR